MHLRQNHDMLLLTKQWGGWRAGDGKSTVKRSSRFGNDRQGHDDLSLWNLKTLGPLFWAEAGKDF